MVEQEHHQLVVIEVALEVEVLPQQEPMVHHLVVEMVEMDLLI
jgi:hypothetical protein